MHCSQLAQSDSFAGFTVSTLHRLFVDKHIAGGGYSLGDNWEFGYYDGKNFAKKRDVIIVAANYRLGPMGFMALDQLKSEDPDGSTGNYALQDQLLALKWTRDNIRSEFRSHCRAIQTCLLVQTLVAIRTKSRSLANPLALSPSAGTWSTRCRVVSSAALSSRVAAATLRSSSATTRM